MADPEQLPEIGLQADGEEEDQDAQLRQELDPLMVRIDPAEQRRARQDATDQLAEHRRLAQTLRQGARQLGDHQDDDELPQKT